MNNRLKRAEHFRSTFKSKIMVLDGAMGTQLQSLNLTAVDFGGEEYEGCNEYLCITRPEHIKNIHRKYLEAGADIIETNTFGGTPIVLQEFNLQNDYYRINYEAAKLAYDVTVEYFQKDSSWPRFVAGSMGPTTKALSVTGGVTFDELVENFKLQAKALYDGGVDYFLLETCQDTRNIKAGLIGINEFLKNVEIKIPVAVSGTIEPMGTMLAGQTVEALANSLEHVELLYLGLNCATGPDFMTDHIRTLSEQGHFNISCVPNAGLPDEDGKYLENPQMVSSVLKRFLEKGWVQVIGGCCGTHEGHIHEMAKIAKEFKPIPHQIKSHSRLSGIDILEINESDRPYFVGERTNVIGSKKFKELIAKENYDEACEIAKNQVKKGAHIIDVCLANPDRNELEDMSRFLNLLVKKIKVPLMIDSTDEAVLEESLKYSQGKAIINSINLEDGEERFEKVIPLAQKYGASLVVGTIDDDQKQGMGVTRERKLEIAKRSYQLLVHKYGVKPTDIYWDPLVFPCATGDENYVGSAVETIEGVALLKKEFPGTKTVLGISNVSFGLPEAGREVLNSVFLYLCTQAGLDLAIVNTEKIKRYSQLSSTEIELAENLLFSRGEDPVARFVEFFRGKKSAQVIKSDLPLEKRLPNYILEGSKDGLIEDLNEYLKTQKPLDIINGPLMEGMAVVGKLFNENKLIVAEVLQSAEVMKAAVSHLEQFMEKNQTAKKGKIVLATVKGDVHDIGKNLVEIVLSNNGFEVINLGIKIPSSELIQAVKEHKPDILGLSGLLVKSAQQMVLSAEDMTQASIDVPILVGGAALSKGFVDKKIAPAYKGEVFYAKDAMNGLDLANTIVSKEDFLKLIEKTKNERAQIQADSQGDRKDEFISLERSKTFNVLDSIPEAQDYDRHVLKNTPIDQIFNYINPLMFYGKHLGIHGKLARLLDTKQFKELEESDEGQKAFKIYQTVEMLKTKYKDNLLKPKAVYQFFHAYSEGNTLSIVDHQDRVLKQFTFPRQNKVDGLCLADLVNPKNAKRDNLAAFVVTVGENIRDEATHLKNSGEYLASHILQILALESAEAYAEYLHEKMRAMWGFADSLEMSMMQKFQAHYRGKRYSFGYPACPNLEDQKGLFELLKPEELGVELTDGFMMEPEASVSALVFHHPEAVYFSAQTKD
jgi:5-methyltetrahydrofolate--homocysteine methyltransferase